MHDFDPIEWQQLLAEAARFERANDVYTAVKLYKRLIRLAPAQVEPYERMGRIYHLRREWKTAFHYYKKTVSLAPAHREGWWRLGIAATGLRKLRLARSVWAKFGHSPFVATPEGLRLSYDGSFEILWMWPLDPARAQIQSIPHPASGYRFREVVLYDRHAVGHHIVAHRRIPVYDELGPWKSSPYQTFSCLLHTDSAEAIQKLEELCKQAGLGFEIWSNATRSMSMSNPQAFPEYYSRDIFPADVRGAHCLAALAAVHEAEVQYILNSWQLITLVQYSDLRAY